MNPDPTPRPSGIKKSRVVKVKDPNKLTEEEMVAFLYLSDDDSENVSTDDQLYSVNSSEDSDIEGSENEEDDTTSTAPVILGNITQQTGIIWSDPPLANRQQLVFSEKTGLNMQPTGDTPVDYFNLLVDDSFYNLIVEQTNIYAEEVFLNSSYVRARITEWKQITKEELRVFLGIFLHTGTIKINRLQDYWRTHRLFNLSCFSDFMGRNRFLLILRCLHFAKNPAEGDETPTDRLYKIGPIINYFNEKMLEVYSPCRELSLDESMIYWRGRLSFRQYLPGKRHKYGIKLYILAEPNGLTLKIMLYTSGARDNISGFGHAVVLGLMQERLDKGHALFMDNFYNSHSLAATLLQWKTYCTGTIRANRKNNCVDVVKKKLRKGEVIEKCDELNGITMAKWHDKRDVTFVSTEYNATIKEIQNQRGQTKLKPEAIIAYNKNMSGVDRKDQMLAYNACDRKTVRWHIKTGIYTLQMLLLNAWFLHNKYSGSKLSFYDFRLLIIEDLLGLKPITTPKTVKTAKTAHLPSELPKSGGTVKRKDCRVCRRQKKRKMAKYCCKICTGQPGLCLEPCFKIWHN